MTIDVTHEREISSSSDIVKWNRQGGDTMLISRTMSNIWEKTPSKDANKVQASQTSKLNQICVRFFLMKNEYILDNITHVEKKIQTGSPTTKMFVKRLARWCLKENCFFFNLAGRFSISKKGYFLLILCDQRKITRENKKGFKENNAVDHKSRISHTWRV